MERVDAYNAQETWELISKAGVSKAKLPWADLILKSFLGGMFISLGGLWDLTVGGGMTGLHESNPSLVSLIGAFVFPIGFVLVTLTNTELVTSNIVIFPVTCLQRKTSLYDLARSWIVSYVFNIAGSLFFAGIYGWWANTLSSDAQSAYAVGGAETRVNEGWGYNFTKGIGCNWLVGLAYYLAVSSKDNFSKIVGIWLPVWAFVGLSYQHCIANFFLVPMGMFYGTNFGVGKYIYHSVIPVTLGNIVGGGLLVGVPFWFLYGREFEETHTQHQPRNQVHDDVQNKKYTQDPSTSSSDEKVGPSAQHAQSTMRNRNNHNGGEMV